MTIHFLRIIGHFNSQHFQRPLPVSACVTPVHSKMGAPEGKLEIVTICNGGPKQTFDLFAHCILPTIVNILELSILVSFYTVKNVSFTRCQPRSYYFRIPFDLFSYNEGVGNLRKMHVRSCRKSFPTDKKITGCGRSVDLRYYFCTYFAKDVDYQVIFLLGCYGELRLWKWVIPLKYRLIFNQRNSNLKIKIRGAVASREQPSPISFRRRLLSSIAVVVDFICVKYLQFCTIFYSDGRAIIRSNHGLPWCVKYMALGPSVATKPSGFAVGFSGARSPSCHVFHTSRQAMIKTYIKHWVRLLSVA